MAGFLHKPYRRAFTVTALIDVTCKVGLVISAFQSKAPNRFSKPKAMNESSSVKPSKVRIAICTIESR